MKCYIKVSPKGQVVLPKILRDALEIDLHEDNGILKKQEGTARASLVTFDKKDFRKLGCEYSEP
jgi:bifunctional DNA-binding transcriptional regulator/antitoxin component of YhaV-PrlF toxin-antitoxin module